MFFSGALKNVLSIDLKPLNGLYCISLKYSNVIFLPYIAILLHH